MSAAPAIAAPAAWIEEGYTTINLDPQFLPTLQSSNVTAKAVGVSALYPKAKTNGWAIFQALPGVVDLGSQPAMEFGNAGGIALKCNSTTVEMRNFYFDSMKSQVTGIVTVNDSSANQGGQLVYQGPLFDSDMSGVTANTKGQMHVAFNNIPLTFNTDALKQLNQAFTGCAQFSDGMAFGTATVNLTVHRM
jgi:hypothetical protein